MESRQQARGREEQQREKARGTRARGGYRGRSGQADILVEDLEVLSDEEEKLGSKDGTDGGGAAQASGDEMEGLYGEWQTIEFVPPTAKNGKVPRGEHGNVELWDKNPALMPGGCCHVEAPWIQQTCNELNIDFAECVTDFKYSVATGGMAPKIEGIIICSDQKARLMAAHATKMAAKQAEKDMKREEQLVQHWKKLIKLVASRARVQEEYA